jgi:hypothetical protein
MSQLETKNKKNIMFTCPNESCGRVFAKPIKALNLQANSAGPYDACPYCLTEITADSEMLENSEKPKIDEVEEEKKNEEKPAAASETAAGCAYHLGYLSERSSKENIPDECMMCKDIVECMLKKMKA